LDSVIPANRSELASSLLDAGRGREPEARTRRSQASERLVAALMRPETYGVRGPVEKRETHASWVFLAGPWAHKVKKPVRLEFLDYSTADRRRAACREELRVNAELGGDIYDRVLAIVPGPDGVELAPEDARGAIDYALRMRRFDERHTLAATIADGRLRDSQLDAVARRLVRFHRDARVCEDGGAAAVARAWRVNLDELDRLDPRQPCIGAAQQFGDAFLTGHGRELDSRARGGLIRDVHGDLRCEHVLLGEAVRVVDRIEFDAALRRIDVGWDLAFLLMDIELHGSERLARRLLCAYRRAGGDPGTDELVWFFAAYWAYVRAKVRSIAAAQHAGDRAGSECRPLLDLAQRLCWRARGAVAIIVVGPPASGKSTLASELSTRSGLPIVSSDQTRKRLAGLAPTERAGPDLYTPELTAQTYRALGRSAAALRASGSGVVIDATCGRAEDRAHLLGELDGDQGSVLFVRCAVPLACALQRAADRMARPERVSDATPEVVARLFEAYEEIVEHGEVGVVDVDGRVLLDEQLRSLTAASDEALARGYVVIPHP
jgi:aminoglycoside phosphotransferase family enzyme/predicted kinase